MPSTFTIVMIVILIVLIAACIALYFFGKRAEKRQAEQQEQMDAAAQTVSMLVIDKKKMKLKEAGLPAVVLENTPKYLRRTKVPVVKAKIGPRIMTLMCDNKVFEVIPVKKEVKAVVSGLYITGIKSVRGGSIEQPQKKKKGLYKNFAPWPDIVVQGAFSFQACMIRATGWEAPACCSRQSTWHFRYNDILSTALNKVSFRSIYHISKTSSESVPKSIGLRC